MWNSWYKIKTLVTNIDLNNVPQRANNNEEKIEKLKTFEFFLLVKIFLVMIFKIRLLINQHLFNIKLLEYKVGIQFNTRV